MIADLVAHDLATPVAVTLPVVTYKTADREPAAAGSPAAGSPASARRDKRRSWARP